MKNFRYIIIFLTYLCFSVQVSKAQELSFEKIDSISSRKVSEILNKHDVDKVLIYKMGCVGCESIDPKECECNLGFKTVYLIWNNNIESKALKIDCCKIFEPETISFDNIWNKINTNSIAYFNSKFNTEFETSHYSFYQIELVTMGESKKADLYSFYFYENNKYYNENIKQPIIELNKLIIEAIEQHKKRK